MKINYQNVSECFEYSVEYVIEFMNEVVVYWECEIRKSITCEICQKRVEWKFDQFYMAEAGWIIARCPNCTFNLKHFWEEVFDVDSIKGKALVKICKAVDEMRRTII